VEAGAESARSPRNRRIADGPFPVALVTGVALLLTIAALVGIVGAANSGGGEVPADMTGASSGEADPALEATLLAIDAPAICSSLLFDAESATAVDDLIEANPFPFSPIGVWTDGIDAGAYAAENVVLVFSLQTDLPQEVTVYDIHAELIEVREPIQGGTLLTAGKCQGEGHEQMRLVINAPEQGPFLGNTGSEFFDEQAIPVSVEEKATVRAEVLIDPEHPVGAYEFKLVIDYEVDGVDATVELDNGGAPFRIATGDCPARVIEPESNDEHLAPLVSSEGPC
jgi:hypothetical protein